tara:strand:- start:362 stop:535 length:174 start_codon:yes stop_codon:yes gene_type:complete
MEPTQITKSETFAVNFVAFMTMQVALKEVANQPKAVREQIEATILQTVLNHPNPAEA